MNTPVVDGRSVNPLYLNERNIHLQRDPNDLKFGFYLRVKNGKYYIHTTEPNSPAERGGLHPNDAIKTINEHPTDQMPIYDLIKLIQNSNDLIFTVQQNVTPSACDISGGENQKGEQKLHPS
ncbi:unnamed protein product, partial [Didymodactylos carnosus]